MTTRFKVRIFSTLTPADASKLLAEANRHIDALIDESEAEDPADEDALAPIDIFDDVELDIEDDPPPGAEKVETLAAGSGTILEPGALERLAACRSTLVVEFHDGIEELEPFVALYKFILAGAGAAVVDSGEGKRIETVESYDAARAKDLDEAWTKVAPLGVAAAKRGKDPKPVADAKVGELESLKLYQRLESILGGRDAFSRARLQRELEQTTDAVRAYASALMTVGPKQDLEIAESLSTTAEKVAAARDGLNELMKRIR